MINNNYLQDPVRIGLDEIVLQVKCNVYYVFEMINIIMLCMLSTLIEFWYLWCIMNTYIPCMIDSDESILCLFKAQII